METVYDNNTEKNVCEIETSHFKAYDTNQEYTTPEVSKDTVFEDDHEATNRLELLSSNINPDFNGDQTTSELLITKHRFDDDFGPETDVDATDDANVAKTPNMILEDNSLNTDLNEKPFSLENKIMQHLSVKHKEFVTNSNPFNENHFDPYNNQRTVKDELTENNSELLVDNKIIDALESIGITNGVKQTHDEDKPLDIGLVNNSSTEVSGCAEKADNNHEKSYPEFTTEDSFENNASITSDKQIMEEHTHDINPNCAATSAGEESDEEDEWNYIQGDQKKNQVTEQNKVDATFAVETAENLDPVKVIVEETQPEVLTEPIPSDAFVAVGETSEIINENREAEAELCENEVPAVSSSAIPTEEETKPQEKECQEHYMQKTDQQESCDFATSLVPKEKYIAHLPDLVSLEQAQSLNTETKEQPENLQEQSVVGEETARPNSLSFDMASKLNPEAKEFVPTGSPTNSHPSSPAASIPEMSQNSFLLLGDDVVAQSPKKSIATMDNIDVPAEDDFQIEMNKCPHELEQFLEHTNGINNGDEIIRSNSPASDPSYQELNLKEAMQCDEKLDNEYNDVLQYDDAIDNHPTELNILVKEKNPMNMSFYEGRDEALIVTSNFDDLNKVQPLPSDDESSEQNHVQVDVETMTTNEKNHSEEEVFATQNEDLIVSMENSTGSNIESHIEQLPQSIFSVASQVVDDVATLVDQMQIAIPSATNVVSQEEIETEQLLKLDETAVAENTDEVENLVSFKQDAGCESHGLESVVDEIATEFDVKQLQTELGQPELSAETEALASPVVEVSQQEITTDNEFITDENVLDVVPSPIPVTHEAPISPVQNKSVNEELCFVAAAEKTSEIVPKEAPAETSLVELINEQVIEEVSPVTEEKVTPCEEPKLLKSNQSASTVSKNAKAPTMGNATKKAPITTKTSTKPSAKPLTAAKTTISAVKKTPQSPSVTARTSTVGAKSPKVATSRTSTISTADKKPLPLSMEKKPVNGEAKTNIVLKKTITSAAASTSNVAKTLTNKPATAKPLATARATQSLAKLPVSAKTPSTTAKTPVSATPRSATGLAKTGNTSARTSTGMTATKPRVIQTTSSKPVGTASTTAITSKTVSAAKRVSSVQKSVTSTTTTSTERSILTTSRSSVVSKSNNTSSAGLMRKTGTTAPTKKPITSPAAVSGKTAPIKNAVTCLKKNNTVSNESQDFLDFDKQLKNDNNQLITKNGIETQMIVIDSAAD